MVKAVFVFVLLGLVAVQFAYGLKCVTCDNCDDDIPEAKDCKEEGDVEPTLAPGYPNDPETNEPPTTTKKPDDKPGDDKPGDDKPGDDKPGDDKPGDDKPGDDKPGDDKPGDDKPGDDKPGDDKPGDDKPGDDKPGDDKPGDDKPGDDKPGDDKPGDDKPGDDKPEDDKPEKPGNDDKKPGTQVRRSIRSANKYLRADEEYKCFKYDIKWGSGTITKRGCTKKKECKEIEAKSYKTNCSVCDSDNCNPASNIKSWAFSSVILVAIVKMFL